VADHVGWAALSPSRKAVLQDHWAATDLEGRLGNLRHIVVEVGDHGSGAGQQGQEVLREQRDRAPAWVWGVGEVYLAQHPRLPHRDRVTCELSTSHGQRLISVSGKT
jgi:hypothetical protein